MTLEDWLALLARRPELVLFVAAWIASSLYKRWKQAQTPQPQQPPPKPQLPRAPRPGQPPRPQAPRPAFPKPAPAVSADQQRAFTAARERLVATLDGLVARGAALADEVRLEPLNRRFASVLEEYLPERVKALKAELAAAPGPIPRPLLNQANQLSVVADEVGELVRQRRDRLLGPALGDVDALADACYQPIVAHAQAEGLPLRSAFPAAQLSQFDLSLWTGFAPTSLAPLFLPPDFLDRVSAWPAVGHEIGHDFLISVEGLEPRLRAELKLLSEQEAARPVRLTPAGTLDFTPVRATSVWFEELFADTFGVLMCGPAYVTTMVHLFGHREDPREVLIVHTAPNGGRLDVHPPSAVRVAVGLRLLERLGFTREAAVLRQRWETANPLGDAADLLLVPLGQRLLGLPSAPYLELACAVTERLYEGPLTALGGGGLRDVSGLDFGPHEWGEAQRAKAALLSGQAPRTWDPRAVISGAVLAWQERPESEPLVLSLARKAVVAKGSYEQRPEQAQAAAADAAGPARLLMEALVLQEVLERRRGPLRRR